MHIRDRETLRAKGLLPDFAQDTWPEETRFIVPSQLALVVKNDSTRDLTELQWGLIPHWAKDPTLGRKTFNARAETVAEKPAFRDAFKRRRCIVMATGFVEWTHLSGQSRKTALLIESSTARPFAFAGLWETWSDAEGELLETCTVITTTPNECVARFHDRMPVILSDADLDLWLDPGSPPEERLLKLLHPCPSEQLVYSPTTIPGKLKESDHGQQNLPL